MAPPQGPSEEERTQILQVLSTLEVQAEEASTAGEPLAAANLYLQAERHLPVCAASARAERMTRAIRALRAAAVQSADAAPLRLALTALSSFLSDIDASFGEAGRGLEEIPALRAEAEALRRDIDATPRPVAATPVSPPKAVPTGPTPREYAAHARRDRRLTGGLAVSASMALAAAGIGLGTRLAIREDGALHHRIQGAADEAPSDLNREDVADICNEVDARGGVDFDPGAGGLCRLHDDLHTTSTVMWITAGTFTAATVVLAVLLARHRRAPLARAFERRQVHFGGNPVRGGASLHLGWSF